MTDAGYNLIMEFEGYSQEAYRDENSNNKPYTIGYGATYYPKGWKGLSKDTKVKAGDRLSSREEARELLQYMVENVYEPIVTRSVTSTLTDHQKDALVSFVYNEGGENFRSSTLLRLINQNPNNRAISSEFGKWNKGGGKVLNGLTRRRTAEAALYFDMSNINVTPDVEVGDGNGNMFTELSNSKDWKMNEFKVIPRKANNWKTLTSGSVHPVVGDILFGFHDADKSGRHDHVAIYLGVHNGSKYVAEGISVAGENINQTDTKVHIAKIEDSRLGLESDIITHFAHCLKTEIKQYEPPKPNYTLTAGSTNNIKLTTKKVSEHFTLEMPQDDQTIENNLKALATNILEPLYTKLNGKLSITSGYRTPEHNASVGGSKTSEHMTGQAADMTSSMGMMTIAKYIVGTEQNNFTDGLPYRQLIIEATGGEKEKGNGNYTDTNGKLHFKDPLWIHVSYNPSSSEHAVKYSIYAGREGKKVNTVKLTTIDPKDIYWG